MSSGRRRLLLSIWALLVFGLAVRALARGLLGADASGPTIRPVSVDLNRASADELTSLPGIGIVRAQAIVLDRIRTGSFRTVADLERVDGLGADVVEVVRPFVVVQVPQNQPAPR